MKKILISFIIYTYFFLNLGNTILRTDSLGEKCFSILPLITEGFFGPIRTIILLILKNNFMSALQFLKFELFRLSNPFSAYFFVYYFYKILKINL